MTRLLVVDSNPEAVNQTVRCHFGLSTGDAYATVLAGLEPGLICTVVRPYDAERAPSFDAFDGMVFTGSGVEWNVEDARAKCLHDAMEQGFKAGIPVFGSCNGMQLAAVVLGGACHASANGREDGVAMNLQLTAAGEQHPMMAGRCNGFSALSVHRDEVAVLPKGAQLLASNQHTAVQAFSYEQGQLRFWGTQYHPEFSPASLASYLMSQRRLPPASVADLAIAEVNPPAAKRLGLAYRQLQFDVRTLELRNWLRQLA